MLLHGNYTVENNVNIFRIPQNTEVRKRWITIIPGDNIPHFKDNVVCEGNWPKDDTIIIDYGKLHPHDPPSVSDCIESSLLPPRKTIWAHSEMRNVIPDELHISEQKDRTEDIDNI